MFSKVLYLTLKFNRINTNFIQNNLIQANLRHDLFSFNSIFELLSQMKFYIKITSAFLLLNFNQITYVISFLLSISINSN